MAFQLGGVLFYIFESKHGIDLANDTSMRYSSFGPETMKT